MKARTPARLRRERWIENIEQFPWIRIYWRALLASIIWRLAHQAAPAAVICGVAYYLTRHFAD